MQGLHDTCGKTHWPLLCSACAREVPKGRGAYRNGACRGLENWI